MLESDPTHGLTITEDLGGCTYALTARRAPNTVFAFLLFGIGALGSSPAGVLLMGLAALAGWTRHRTCTYVALTPHGVTVRHTRFDRVMDEASVPYEGIRQITREDGWLGASTLILHRIDGPELRILHGTHADHESLRLAIDARRPIQRIPDAAEVAPPAALGALREG